MQTQSCDWSSMCTLRKIMRKFFSKFSFYPKFSVCMPKDGFLFDFSFVLLCPLIPQLFVCICCLGIASHILRFQKNLYFIKCAISLIKNLFFFIYNFNTSFRVSYRMVQITYDRYFQSIL